MLRGVSLRYVSKAVIFSARNTATSSSTANMGSQRIKDLDKVEIPVPRSVEAVYYKPLKHPIKYGDLVANLQLRSYDNRNLDFFSDFILRVGYYLGMPMTGPKPIPTRRERWTVIRSPFAQAKSKENFERHTHKRVIRVWDTNLEVLDIWLSYISKRSITGVGMKCNIFKKEGIKLNSFSDDIDLPKVSELKSMDESIGSKVVEILNNPEFKKYM